MRCRVCLVLLALSFLLACEKEKSPTSSIPGFYSESANTGCKDGFGRRAPGSAGGSVLLSSFNDTIRIFHANAYYNCCSDMQTDVAKTRLGYDVFEVDRGDSCDCWCYMDITTLICHVPMGTHLIRLLDINGGLVERGYVVVKPDDSGGPGQP